MARGFRRGRASVFRTNGTLPPALQQDELFYSPGYSWPSPIAEDGFGASYGDATPYLRSEGLWPVSRSYGPTFSPLKGGLGSRSFEALRPLQVRVPMRARFCVQRKQRREVLFAFRRVGYSGSSPGRRNTYRRTANSHWRC